MNYMGYEFEIKNTSYVDGIVGIRTNEGLFLSISEIDATEEELSIIEVIRKDVESRPIANSYDNRIAELKKLLSDTDYVAIKIAEGSATIEEYAEVIAQRKLWREEINSLEAN